MAIFFEIGSCRSYVLLQAEPWIAALADGWRFGIGVQRFDGKFRDTQPAAWHERARPFGIDFHHGLRRNETQFIWAGPAKRAAAFRNLAQNRFRTGGAEAS